MRRGAERDAVYGMSEARASKSFAMGQNREPCSDGALSPSGSVIRLERRHASTERRGYSAFLWLNLICLDAPIVALSWQWLFAKMFVLPVDAPSRAALFLTAWLIYLADRLGDSLTVPPGARMSLRQVFCARHHKVWIGVLGLVAMIDAVVIEAGLNVQALVAGVVIGAVALIYLIVNHRWSRLWRVLPLKEISIGILFASGTIASLLPTTSAFTPSFMTVSLLFALLCALNCMCIARWERTLDLAQARSSIATAWPRIADRVLIATLSLAAMALASMPFAHAGKPAYFCVALSALGLAALDKFGDDWLGDTRTACADLVLLTPLLIVAW